MTNQIKPSVLFVCVHNAGRSQMAAGFLRHLARDAVEVRSAGSAPADQINPASVPGFVAFELIGAAIGLGLVALLFPRPQTVGGDTAAIDPAAIERVPARSRS